MNENPDGDSVPPRRWLRRGIIALAVLLPLWLVVVQIGWNIPGLDLFSERGRHMRTLGRIDGHLRTAMDADPRAKASMTATRENARLLLLSVMQKALWNVLYYTKDSSPEKLRAIDGRLEATSEADLRTVDGCLEVFALFEEASPRFKQYGPTLEIYMLQEQGEIPRRATRK